MTVTNQAPPPPVTAGPQQLATWLDAVHDDVHSIRRTIHANPELSHEEYETTQLIEDTLKQAGVHTERSRCETGLWADINDTASGPFVAFRVDIDALPITETTGLPYASQRPGAAHACGHDMHTAIGLGVASVMQQAADAGVLHHPVRIIFQPAEETPVGGATDMIAAGALEDVCRIVALHCDPGLTVGRVGMREGPITSAADMLYLKVTGPGGHTSRPHLSADVVHALSTLVCTMPTVLSRRVDPRGGASLMWGAIQAGTSPNVIPSEGVLSGTLRCLDETVWRECEQLIPQIVHEILCPFAVGVDLDHARLIPPVVNEATTVRLLRAAATAELGDEAVVGTPQSLGGEDFSHYLHHVPGAMFRLGTLTPGGRVHDLHQSSFDLDERCLRVGMQVVSRFLLDNGR